MRAAHRHDFNHLKEEHNANESLSQFSNGNREAAFKFYEQCLGGKVVAMMTYESFRHGGAKRPLNGATRSCTSASNWATGVNGV